jgi:hypothetical protein
MKAFKVLSIALLMGATFSVYALPPAGDGWSYGGTTTEITSGPWACTLRITTTETWTHVSGQVYYDVDTRFAPDYSPECTLQPED